MRHFKWRWTLLGVMILALALAACGSNDDENKAETTPENSEPTVQATEETGQFNPAPGPGLALAPMGGTQMPGCSDPSDSECPAPLDMDLDGTASDGGITVNYPTRYFNATTGSANASGVPIEIAPNDNYKFQEQAVFQLYFDDSLENALSLLTEPDQANWHTDNLGDGVIAVERDEAQDPPVNTTLGVFPLEGGNVIVFKLQTTGKYGWDLYTRVYEAMLNSITVTSPPTQ